MSKTLEQLAEHFCEMYDFRRDLLDEPGYLDEMVHDAKGEEATAINNCGLKAQLEYLLGMESCSPLH